MQSPQLVSDVYWGGNSDLFATKTKKRKLDVDVALNDEKRYEIYDPLIYTYGKTIHFSSDIKKITIEIIIKQIYAIIEEFYTSSESKDEDLLITYVVDSPGGSVTSILKFVDFLNMARKNYPRLKFKSIISGLAASAGTIMACVADERQMTKNAKAMIHDLASQNGGSYTQIMAHSDFLKDLNNALIDIYVSKSNKSKDELTELLKTNKWFNSNEYLDYGFVDVIV